MIYGKKNVLSWFESTAMPYWTIYTLGKTESGNPAMKSDEGEHVTHAMALEDLNRRLPWINGKYTIIASAVAKSVSKGTFREDFQTSLSEESPAPSVQMVQPPAIAGLNNEDIEKRIKEGIQAALQHKENQELKEKVKELEKENKTLQDNSPLAKVAGIAEKYAPQIIAMLNPSPAPVARVAGLTAVEEQATQEPDADQARLENIVAILSEIDPEWLIKLEKLALKVQANPSLWGMVNNFL